MPTQVITYYLEMTDPAEFRPVRRNGVALEVKHARVPCPELNRFLYTAVGGFAPLPLMEDVDLVRRLGRRHLARIGAQCVSSPRRYRREGYWRRPLRNLFCLSLYFAGVPPERIARLYG